MVELEDIPAAGLEISFNLKPSYFEIAADEFNISEHVLFDCSLTKKGREVYVQGDMKTDLRLVCARCLASFIVPLNVHLEIDYLPKWILGLEEEVELEAGDLNKYYYEGDSINLKDAVRDYIVTAVPIKPLCSEECKGLCHKCGKNLNVETCSCSGEDFNDRFEVLKLLEL